MAAWNPPPRGYGTTRGQRRVLLVGSLLLIALVLGVAAVAPAAFTRARDGGQGEPGVVNGLAVGRDCATSVHARHQGFARAPRCVVTQMGEVPTFAHGPQLLITRAPRRVQAGETFTLLVSSRNLVRDRFPAAADGGYLLERADLTADGLTRGHFHTACRSLGLGTTDAPDPEVPVDFFEATEDGGGGATSDAVEVTVAGGIAQRGLAQCAVWAGDGSHRIPMMASPQQIPPFDTVMLVVE